MTKPTSFFRWCHAILAFGTLHSAATADVRITELMFHPQHAELTPEPVLEEFIEIHNTGTLAVDLTAAEFTSGVAFTFPSVSIAPGQYLVVAADPTTFAARHPTVEASSILGPWTGKLSNSGESVRLRDASGGNLDLVTYADEGDWATRIRGPQDNGHRGWTWESGADGLGASLELVNVALTNNQGRNWGASSTPGGTPAAPNSIASSDIPPIIRNPSHQPLVPNSTDPVTVSCSLLDEAPGATAVLHYRVDGDPDYTSTPMTVAPDGRHTATVPPNADRTIIEFYITATDATSKSRTWPAPARQTDGSFSQSTNALFQVDDSHDGLAPSDPAALPVMRVVMTADEHDELDAIGNSNSDSDSNAQMNATFISNDASGVRAHYLCGIRNRGASSRNNNPNNQLVTFRSDDPWDGRKSIKFNAVSPYSQVLGSVLFRRFGVETAEAIPVHLRLNGDDDATSGSPMYGAYAMVESFDSTYAANHWPGDPGGNIYQVRDDESTGEEGQLQDEGGDKDDYRNTYFKQSNSSADDFSDLIALTDVLNNTPPADLFNAASQHAHLSQWARMLAIDTLLGNREGGLVTSKGDDYALYSGVTDPRFFLVPHDLDSLGAAGTQQSTNASIFGYAGVDGLEELFDDSQFLVLFYGHIIDIITNLYTHEVTDPIIDSVLGHWVSAGRIAGAKSFIDNRPGGVLNQVPLTFASTTNLPTTAEGYHRTNNGAVTFSGDFDASRTLSLFVNETPAQLNHRNGEWSLSVSSGGTLLNPGLNRVVIRAYDGLSGSGNLIYASHIDVWNNTGGVTPVSGTLTGSAPAGTASLISRPDYIPGIPFLVRVELRNDDGSINTNRWDATATLTSNRPDLTLTPNTVTLYNGRGSALVTVVGGGGGGSETNLIPRGATWHYLDDGSDQQTAWRQPGFDDTGWESGPAELGYGDTQDTLVDFIDTVPGGSDQKNATTYFRTTFEVADPATLASLAFELKYDDGAIVYLNGTEAFRTPNMTGVNGFDQFANEDVDNENLYYPFSAPAALLVAGENTIAVEIHQGDDSSSDISFDLELNASGLSTDPGDFNLNASVGGRQLSQPIVSLGETIPAPVSGTLSGGSTTWSGIVHVNGDLTVPSGHTLTVEPGTIVLLDGDSTPGSTAGTDIIVEGTLLSQGTANNPVTFTASRNGDSWGQFRFDGAGPSSFHFTHIHRAGHAPGGGHTGKGRCVHILGSEVTFEDSSISDNFGKIGESDSSGGNNSSLTILRSHLARSVMGFETTDTEVLVDETHITDMLGFYREDGQVDDDDAIYLHEQAPGQTLVIRNTVVANTEDDGIDTLRGENVIIDNVISRDCLDKGVSMLGGSGTVTRSIFANNDIGFSVKNDGSVVFDHVTVAGNTSIGIQAENKNGDDAPSFYAVTNSIILGPDAIVTDYEETDLTFNYCILGEAWPHAGSANNALGNPLFVSAISGDFHLTSASPAIDAADPAAPLDPDSSRADIGRFPYDPAFDDTAAAGEVVWSPEGSPYHVVDDVTIPEGLKFVVQPGTAIYLDSGKRITVEGTIQALGTPTDRIQVNALPGAPFEPDTAGNGSLPDAPPKSAGIKLVGSVSPDNIISYLDIGNAQDNNGSIGIIDSECIIDNVTFRASHIRMLYIEDSSVIVQYCTFPDMFAPGESPDALGLDNVSEHIKGVGQAPDGGHYIIRYNTFGTNKGHNDVIDIESPRLPDPIAQIIGNTFSGAGDELLDLGGDVYVAENFFYNVFKDDETSDRGYANAISTGDSGTGTTIAVARNIFWDVDHAINLKRDTATIFENNTVYKIHPDFNDRFDNPSVSSVINLFIPTDTSPTPGDGAYASGNILTDLTRLYSGADAPGDRVTPLEFHHNLLDPSIPDTSISPERPGETIYDLGSGNVNALPGFIDPDNGDFRLTKGSPAIGTGPLGRDFGALTPAGIWIAGEPPAVTSSTSATLTVGAPGIFGYRWRLDGGPWSADTDIGTGFDPPNPTVRTATIQLTSLADGPHTVEVEGRNFAGAWQDTPTVSKTWTVTSALPASARLNEILATGTPDAVELFNPGTLPFDLTGHFLTDSPNNPTKLQFAPGASIPSAGFLVVQLDPLAFSLSSTGESLTLFAPDGTTVLDSVSFGHQPPGFTLGRTGHDSQWTLNQPTLGAPNAPQPTGSPSSVYISEWFTRGQVVLTDDFLELFNPLPVPVDISGLFLTDNPNSQPALFPIPPLSFVGPQAAVAFTNGTHQGFALSSTTEAIALLAPGGDTIDAVVYTSQTPDFSQRRTASGNTGFFRLPTPGQSIPTPGSAAEIEFLRVLALYDDLRITEVMYDPIQGTDFEFIEFQNTGSATLDLSGLRVTTAVDFKFPPATLVAPGEFVLIVSSQAAFESLYGKTLPVAGEYSGKLSNGGEEIVVLLPEPYEAAILRFSYDDAWHPITDGGGKSLVFTDPSLPVIHWGTSSSWTPSPEDGGNPAGFSTVASGFPAWLTDNSVTGADKDSDLDGIEHLLEYTLGFDPNQSNSLDLAVTIDPQGHPAFSFPLAEPARSDITVVIEASSSLDTPDWITIATKVGQGPWTGSASVNGNIVVTDSNTTFPGNQLHFYRIKAFLTP